MSQTNRLSLQEAAAYLTLHPDEIHDAWSRHIHHPAGMLFAFIAPDFRPAYGDALCGCPIIIKDGAVAIDDEGREDTYLTTRIRRFGIPNHGKDLTVKHLRKMVQIQNIADAYYREKGWRT